MADEQQRIRLSSAEAAFLTEIVAGYPNQVRAAAALIASGQVVPDEDAELVVDALSNEMLGDRGYNERDGLTEFGLRIDDIISVAQQMSEHFYD